MGSELQIGFALDKIKTEQFAVIGTAFKEDKPVNISSGLSFALDHENKNVRVAFSTSFLHEEAEAPFIILEVACFFSLKPEDFETLVDKETSKVTLPSSFAKHLAVLTVGTTRGILHAKLENTKFRDYFLPTVNVSEMVQEDVPFN